MGEVGRDEAGVAVDEVEFDGVASLNLVGNVGCAQRDEQVVVAVPVHECRLARRDLDFEYANLVVLECEMVGRLGGDFDFGGLGEESQCRQNQDEGKARALHEVDCNSRVGPESAAELD